jgi:hypothetical protein
LFSDKEINEAFNKHCPKKEYCSFLSKVGDKNVEINIRTDGKSSNPTLIAFSEPYKEMRPWIVEKPITFTPKNFTESQKGFVNAQLSRSIAVALSDDFLVFQNALSSNLSITPEAYLQSKTTIDSCIELMTKMAPEDKSVIAYSKYALDSLKKLNDAGKRAVASDPKGNHEYRGESNGISK